ncbi:glycoside hydrolase family 39 protein [Bipolaris victoriae FI3]|uniref:Glycoside hydrolase family 39 protein n=1 Tax=Bipolaris victoriae (strain FI3) TaxID=930091 RepID=W7F152_BIPV3|nr:glycoside hydrolase family 39 protein [Bipolaris victoriae FI3]
MRSSTIASILLSSLTLLEAASIRRAAKGVATVDLSKTSGQAKSLASGWIYGFPDNGTEVDTSIPANYITDVKFGASRAGGAQTSTRGWVDGYDSYLPRFKSTLSNYRTTRKYNGEFILLVHDLWGADGSSIPLFPGDNGNYTETDAFLTQLVKDIKANNMLDGLILDIWNEPDIDLFWARTWPQFLDYYVHAHNFLRKKLPSTMLSGPSMAASPSTNSENWQTWLSTIASKNAVPDIYSWHQIGSWSRQPDATIPDFNTLRSSNKLPERPIDINEYAAKEEQTPGCSVYYIAQLERHNLRGLRANWGSGTGLHDSLANLVFPESGAGYRPNGEWQLYKYYAGMTGERLATKAADDSLFDVFATKSADGLVKVIAGTRIVEGQYDIQISGLEGVAVSVATYRFDWAGPAGEIGAPVALGTSTVNVSDGMITISVDPATNATAYAYEISGGK